MKKFLLRLLIFLVLTSSILILILETCSYVVKRKGFKNHETDSNTLVMKEGEHFNWIISGVSHARALSRDKNHLQVESILQRSVINIAQGRRTCGLNEQFFYLKYFISRQNTVDKLVYLLSPHTLFSEVLPIASNTFEKEEFDTYFFLQYLFFPSENKYQRIMNYVQSKPRMSWIKLAPFSHESMALTVTDLDSKRVQAGLKNVYTHGLNPARYQKSCELLEKEIQFCEDNQIEVNFVIPPSLFGKWPGHELVLAFINQMDKKYDINFYDFSESIQEPKYFYDYHHLNTEGVIYFSKHCLSQLLD